MDYTSPHTVFRLGKQRTLVTEKKVKILTEGSVLAVGKLPGGQSCMEKNSMDAQSPWLPKPRLGWD